MQGRSHPHIAVKFARSANHIDFKVILDFFSPFGIIAPIITSEPKDKMARVKVYSTAVCPFCQKTKHLLQKWGIPFEEVRIDQDRNAQREFVQVTNGARTVPQIVIDGKCIGGFTELTELHMEGGLDELVEAGPEK